MSDRGAGVPRSGPYGRHGHAAGAWSQLQGRVPIRPLSLPVEGHSALPRRAERGLLPPAAGPARKVVATAASANRSLAGRAARRPQALLEGDGRAGASLMIRAKY